MRDKGAGIFLHLSAENMDEFYSHMLADGLKPVSEPQDDRGNREFILRDLTATN